MRWIEGPPATDGIYLALCEDDVSIVRYVNGWTEEYEPTPPYDEMWTTCMWSVSGFSQHMAMPFGLNHAGPASREMTEFLEANIPVPTLSPLNSGTPSEEVSH